MRKNFKIISLCILAIIIISSLYNLATLKEDTKTLKIAEVTHSIFYTPLYVAIENNFFEDENLDVELILTSGADKVSAAVLSGDVHIGLAGAESAIYIYENGQKDYLQIFSGLTKRDGQFILSSDTEKENFKLTDLENKEILIGRESGMPALNFLYALNQNNIDISNIKINTEIDFASLSAAFITGTGDYVNLFEPNASILENKGYGKIVASVGELSGELPYTVFYSKKSYLENNEDILRKFTNAIQKALEYTLNTDSDIIAEKIKNQFPDQSVKEISMMIENYKKYDCWLDNTNVTEESFENLENLLTYSNLINNIDNYNKIVINLNK